MAEEQAVADFLGEFARRLNGNNQVTIPAHFRTILPEEDQDKGFYLVQSNPQCLCLYTHSEISRQMAKAKGTMSRAKRRKITRRIQPVEMDGQGRIVIPSALKDAVGIEKDAIFVGNLDRIEIWEPGRLKRADEEPDAGTDEQVDEVMFDLFEG